MIENNQIGRRLRLLRFERELTLQQVSDLCSIAISTLSKLENGQVSPSYGTIKKIADGLDIPLEQLVGDKKAENLGARFTITDAKDAICFSNKRYDFEIHAGNLSAKAMVPLIMHIKSRDVPDLADWSSHPGEEFIFVLQGNVEVHLEHYAPFRLQEGSSAYIDSGMAHAFVSTGAGDAIIFTVAYDPTHRMRNIDEIAGKVSAA